MSTAAAHQSHRTWFHWLALPTANTSMMDVEEPADATCICSIAACT